MITSGPVPATLLDILRRARSCKRTAGMRFFRGAREVDYVSYDELYEDAGRIAGRLAERMAGARSERVALVVPTSADYVRGFFGILAAGAVPVPLPPPIRFSSLRRFGDRIRGALVKSDIRLVLASEKIVPILEQIVASLGVSAQVVSVADLRQGAPDWHEVSPHDPALVQYTSGSTSLPKGVVLTHGQIVANLRSITLALDVRDDDIACNWLPLFHDMGLIGCLLGSIYSAIDQLLLPADDFTVEPLTWLRLIDCYRATLAVAPNWAYVHCTNRIQHSDAKLLDLSRWRAAMNGAEMVDARGARRFAQRFRVAGFRPEAMLPVYGLAEASLAVTFSTLGHGVTSAWVRGRALSHGVVQLTTPDEADSKEVVALGTPVSGVEICLRGGEGQSLAEGMVGEILIRGPSVMSGYDRDVEATNAVFRQGWLGTGDLGFLLDGELYVVGRAKEMIVVRGQNFYSHDIEALAGDVTGVWSRNTMAISVPADGTEALVLLAETRERDINRRQRLVASMHQALSATLGTSPLDVVLIRPGELPRTSSGKLERYKGVSLYEEHCSRTRYDAEIGARPAGDGSAVAADA